MQTVTKQVFTWCRVLGVTEQGSIIRTSRHDAIRIECACGDKFWYLNAAHIFLYFNLVHKI